MVVCQQSDEARGCLSISMGALDANGDEIHVVALAART
jgi:hypothetical protein